MNFKKLYKPHKEFKDQTRVVFMSAFKERFPVNSTPSFFSWRNIINASASGVALVLILTASATYADQKNVGPNNIFYALKRSYEVGKVILIGEDEEPGLHFEFAERRLEEIKEIQEKNPESPELNELSDDFDNEFRSSIEKIKFSEIKNSAKNTTPTAPAAPKSRSLMKIETLDNSTPSITDSSEEDTYGGEEINDIDKTKKANKSGTNPKELSSLESKQFNVCSSWQKLINTGDINVFEVINHAPQLVQRFEERCLPILGTDPTEEDNFSRDLKADSVDN